MLRCAARTVWGLTHAQARAYWEILRGAGAKLHTSVPVVIETFTFLERNANRDVALTWKDSLLAGCFSSLAWGFFRLGSQVHQPAHVAALLDIAHQFRDL